MLEIQLALAVLPLIFDNVLEVKDVMVMQCTTYYGYSRDYEP